MSSSRTGPRTRRSGLVFAVVLVLAVGGGVTGALLASRNSTSAPLSFPSAAPSLGFASPGVGPNPGKPAPEFSVRSLDGRTLHLADFRGRPTVLYFMAYWCSDCIPGAQALGRIYNQFSGRTPRCWASPRPWTRRAPRPASWFMSKLARKGFARSNPKAPSSL